MSVRGLLPRQLLPITLAPSGVNASTAKGLAACLFPGPPPSAGDLYLENAGLYDSPDAGMIRHASGCTLRGKPHLLSKPLLSDV